MVVAAAYRAVWDRLPDSTAWKIGSFGGVMTMTPRLQTRFTLFAPHAANRSPTAGPPGTAALSVTTVWLGRSDCSRRDTRQWKNGSGAVRSAAATIRH